MPFLKGPRRLPSSRTLRFGIGLNGDREIANISGMKFKYGTVQLRFVRFAGQVRF
ncbi:hypothetical protein YC2023_035075 [Brassica napus]